MQDVTITVLSNGPYIVTGARVLDAEGNEFEAGDTVALCRCGHSGSKPFCDGTHRSIGFESEARTKEAA